MLNFINFIQMSDDLFSELHLIRTFPTDLAFAVSIVGLIVLPIRLSCQHPESRINGA